MLLIDIHLVISISARKLKFSSYAWHSFSLARLGFGNQNSNSSLFRFLDFKLRNREKLLQRFMVRVMAIAVVKFPRQWYKMRLFWTYFGAWQTKCNISSLENLTKLILMTQRPRIDQVKTTTAGKSIPGPNSAWIKIPLPRSQ